MDRNHFTRVHANGDQIAVQLRGAPDDPRFFVCVICGICG
jgi:hypothetical protein